jgi:SAM-dependent methyltransferase
MPENTEPCCCGTPSDETTTVQAQVREYYGSTLQSSSDLQTSASCSTESLPADVRAVLPLIAPEIRERFYGCGSSLPSLPDGLTVLDLGCGTGRDCFVAARLVGAGGCAEVWA